MDDIQTNILEFLKTIITIALQALFVIYVDKLANSLAIAVLACILLNIVWNQIAINKVLETTGLDVNNPNDHEEIAKKSVKEKDKMWPYISASWIIVPAMYELMRFF